MKTLITYFKTRAIKQISQWLVIAALSILISGAFAVADAYAAFTLPKTINPQLNTPLLMTLEDFECADLQGGSAGTCDLDEGCMDFENDPPSASLAAEICAPTEPFTGDELQPFELHGWVWDTNLGYVSLHCDENGNNNGATCGSIEYGVTLDLTTGDMSGWAWSDNFGWISFGCQDGLNQGHACGSVDYSTTMDLAMGETFGTISGYAWADTVGWFDFETGNAHAKILSLMLQQSNDEVEWGIWTKAEIEDETDERVVETMIEEGNPPIITKDIMPLADSNSGYDIFVHLVDITGATIEDTGGDVVVEISTEWDDTVKYDQTSSEASNGNPLNNGPAYKAGLDVDARPYTLELSSTEATTGGVVNSYHGITTSRAPTDGGNCYDADGDGSCYGGEGDFLYKDFGDSVEPNVLTYLGANVTVTIPATGETWSEFISPLPPYTSGRRLDFKPFIDIPTLDYLFTPGDTDSGIPFIQAIRNKVDEFYINATDNGIPANYTVEFALSEEDEDVEYVFIDDLEENFENAESTFTLTDVAALGTQLLAIPYSIAEEDLEAAVPGATLQTKVDINPNPSGVLTNLKPHTVYYNNGLPRVFDSEIETQNAEIISGNVFSPGAKDVVEGSNVPLFGDTATYVLRTQILEDVSALLRGVTMETATLPVTINDGTTPTTLYKNVFKDNRLYYFENQDVTIENLGNLIADADGKPITIILKGGDLYIRSNMDYSDQELGFIVFESDEDTDQATKGGRIYIHADVTDMVNVHMFSDGPVFRYNNDVCYYTGTYGPSNNLTGLREPNFVDTSRPCSTAGSFQEPTSALSNQFYLKGNMASFNCLGCSTDLDPSRGDGKALGGPSARNFAIARLYDLNYFSYFREDPLNPGSFSGNRSTNVDTHPNITNKDKAVYFEYSAAPTDLLGFRNF
ncbi:hypothetical protein GF369_00735 [Candidatus Peregrinibacteria bacterium]|nr:hypothetical protein [Candidatus Peregrinibacteria bacterium]